MNVVCFNAERLKYKNVGLYHFCINLGEALLKLDKEDADISLQVYSRHKVTEFGNSTNYKMTKSYHKLFHYFKTAPDIWHETYQLSGYLPKNKKIKKILTVHDLNFLREKTASKQRKYLKQLQSNVNNADVLVCISNFVKSELQEYCNLNNRPIKVIYNGNNIKEDVLLKKPLNVEIDWSIPFIFSIGAILKKKNFHVLPYLLVGNDYNLIVAGDIVDQTYYDRIMQISGELNVKNRVHFIGSVTEEEKYFLYKNCHLFAFSSITEGFGLPVVEAMHFGCSILLSPMTSLPEIGGDVVRYFRNFDEDYLIELGASIPNFVLTEQEKKKVKERSLLFNWENAAAQYWELYKSMLS